MALWCCATLCVVVLVTCSSVLAQTVPDPSYAVLPADTTAAVGYSVTIYCSIANLGRNQVFWHFDGTPKFTLGPNTNVHSSYPRFKFVGNARNGEFNLQISNVSAADAGMYICLVRDPIDVGKPALEVPANLIVVNTTTVTEVGFPRCTRSPLGMPSAVYTKGDVLTLTCTSKGGVPRPELAWTRVSLNTQVINLQTTVTVSGDVTTATAKVTLASSDHQSFYKCTETHPARPPAGRTCMTPFSGSESVMDVRFKPEVTITPDVVTVQLLQTTKVTLSCTADANPLLTTTPEILLPENVTAFYPRGAADKSLVEVEMTTDDVGKDFFCRAGNVLGIGEDRVEVRRLGALPTWLILVVMAVAAVVIFIFITIICCICCVDRPYLKDAELQRSDEKPIANGDDEGLGEEDEHDEDVFIDNDLIPINDFEGGQEAIAMEDRKTDINSDFETGETGPRYQNVNEVLQQDDPVTNELDPSPEFDDEPTSV